MTEITTKYYVKVDSETGAIVEAPTGTKADGLIEVNVLPSTAEYLTRYWQHYQIVNGVPVKQLKWLPDLSIDHLLNVINVLEGNLSEANTTVGETNKQLATANATITQLQGMAGSLTGQVAQANQTIDQLQALTGQLTGQVAKIQLAQTATTE